MDNELLSLLNHELGQIQDWEELCPGVYYLGVLPHPDNKSPSSEYYLVLDNAPSEPDTEKGRSRWESPSLLPVPLYSTPQLVKGSPFTSWGKNEGITNKIPSTDIYPFCFSARSICFSHVFSVFHLRNSTSGASSYRASHASSAS